MTVESESVRFAVDWSSALAGSGGGPPSGHDPALIPETLRQAGIAMAHVCCGVPRAAQFIMADMTFSVVAPKLLVAAREGATLSGLVTVSEAVFRDSRFRRAVVHLHLEGDRQVMAEAFSTLRCVDAVVYGRLRSTGKGVPPTVPCSTGLPVDPTVVGRLRREEVLVWHAPGCREPGTWRVRVDSSNQELFDHPVDHVPGMVQIEVCRQAALATTWLDPAAGRSFSGCALQFRHIVELDRPTWCRARPVGRGTVAVELFHDGERRLTEGVLHFSGRPDRACRNGIAGKDEPRCATPAAS
jgi:hypothetical protein